MAKKPADQTAETTRESDVAFIRALAQLLDENDLTELQVKREYGESDRLTVRVSRRPAAHAHGKAIALAVFALHLQFGQIVFIQELCKRPDEGHIGFTGRLCGLVCRFLCHFFLERCWPALAGGCISAGGFAALYARERWEESISGEKCRGGKGGGD